MKTPGVSIFVVVVLVLGVALAFYDYSKHGAREEQGKISKYEAYKLKNTKLLGAEESYKGDYEKAIKDYKAALKIAPRDAYLHNDLGTAYYYLGLKSINPPIKEDEFEFGIEVDARHLKKSEVLPKVKEALNKTDSGIITVVMVDQDAKDEVVAFAQSLKYIVNVEEENEAGKREFWVTIVKGKTAEAFKKAEDEFLKAIAIKSVKDQKGRRYSSYATASRNLGVLYFRMGRKKDAIAQWRRAFQLEPTDAELRNLLGKYEQK